MNAIKWFFMSKYKKLLYSIMVAERNDQRLHLPNGIVLDFRPGHEYDSRKQDMCPRECDGESFYKKYIDKIGQVVHMDVYDCFGGDVKILAVGEDVVFVEVVDVTACYSCQEPPRPGMKYWVGDWELPPDLEPKSSRTGFEDKDLPF